MATLIIGGSGLLGKKLCQHLGEEGHEVVSFDLYPIERKIKNCPGAIVTVSGNINNIDEIINVIKEYKIQSIINLAYILGSDSEVNPQKAIRVNIMGMNNVFEAARLMGIRRVVYPSSIAVYGKQSEYGDRPVTENDPCNPTLVYGAHKMLNEFMAKKYIEKYGMTIPGLRIGMLSSPERMTAGISAWVSTIINLPALGKDIRLPVCSTQKVLFTPIDDAVVALKNLCFTKTPKYPIYNSTGHTSSSSGIAAIVNRYSSSNITFDEDGWCQVFCVKYS